MTNFASELVGILNLEVLETIEIPGRAQRRSPLPNEILEGPLSAAISSLVSSDGTAWQHQSLALDHLCSGKNVVVSTGTASGKSLIFQLYALHRSLADNACALVFYPLKALASDQYGRWLRMAEAVGLSADRVVRIDGDTLMADRNGMLDRASIVLMTPDVCHAWLMRNVGSGLVRRFLERLDLLVLDEAHVYESVFGSNVAFLIRRLIAARRRAMHSRSEPRRLQILAATATIAEPAEHLRGLTGLDYEVVGEADNGAPSQERQILHVNGAEFGAAGEAALVDLISGISKLSARRRFIAFFDSRQGIERTVQGVASLTVYPYRSGYEAEDRSRIEAALKGGELDGVVATSALELGIDIADMEIGVNLGVPQSRKAFRQRIGRIGRTSPGAFFLVAPPNAFKQFGQTFRDYYEGSVEPSYLYLGNRFIQFAQARCTLDELEVLGGDKSSLPSGAHWPEGFAEAIRHAKPGGGRPREFDAIAQLGADSPHLNYPLRQVGEASFDLKEGPRSMPGRLGTIATNQAIREAYPGANYLHFGHAYKVLEWNTRGYERAIRLARSKNPMTTRPLLRTTLTLSLDPDGVVGQRIRRNSTGVVAEVHLQVNQSVEGYTMGRTTHLYKDLRAENPNMSRKQRDFRTTGILVKIDEPWFAGTKNGTEIVREKVVQGLLGLVCRDRSISPQDVDAAHTNIALLSATGPKRLTDAVVIYDSVYGGLRLTEDLFNNMERYVNQLGRAADMAGQDAIVDDATTEHLKQWVSKLADDSVEAVGGPIAHDGWYQIYKPGSIIGIIINGNLVEREILEPRLIDPFQTGSLSLFYLYKTSDGQGFIPHDQAQATGHDWNWVLWNPESNSYQDLDDGTISTPLE
jgi:DEAD/DEAH box helicase domain-containing protein